MKIILLITFILYHINLAYAADTSGDSGEQKQNYEYTKTDSKTFNLAKKEIAAKNFPRAIELLEEELQSSPSNADVWNLIGFSERNIENFEKSMKAYNKALSLEPNHKGALEYKGELYLKLGDLKNAQKLLEKLNNMCNFNCKERDALKKSINQFKLNK